MCCHVRNASVSRRRRPPRHRLTPLPPLAVLDLSKPGERQAHDFLRRATSKRDQMWELYRLRRQGDVLLCVVRWVRVDNKAKPFSLAEVSLTAIAVHWRDFASAAAARAAMERIYTAPTATSQGTAWATSP